MNCSAATLRTLYANST